MILRLCVAALLLLPPAAFAQGNPGPFGGLFGRTPERTGNAFTAIEFRNSYAGQYDDAVLADDLIPVDEVPKSGATLGANAGLAFVRHTDRFRFSADGGATYQEFYRNPVFGATTYNGGVQARGLVTTRLQLDGQARYVRSPFFRLASANGLFGSPVVIPGDPFFVRMLTNESYQIGGRITNRYSRSSTLSFTASQRQIRFGGASANVHDVVSMEGRWRRQLSRSLGVHAAYGRERIHQTVLPEAEFTHEVFDIGVDFNRQFSFWRRTSFSITTQTSAVKRPITGRRYRLNGNATLAKQFARTWRASAGVSRNTEFVAGFVEPLMSDAFTAMISGMVSRRTEWLANVSAGKGRFGFDGGERVLTGQLSSRLNFAITRHIGVFGQYALYHFDHPSGAAAILLPSRVSRQAFTVGINTWVPILNRVRAPRDPE